MRGTPGAWVWQRNYHEHIVRDNADLARIQTYIYLREFWTVEQRSILPRVNDIRENTPMTFLPMTGAVCHSCCQISSESKPRITRIGPENSWVVGWLGSWVAKSPKRSAGDWVNPFDKLSNLLNLLTNFYPP